MTERGISLHVTPSPSGPRISRRTLVAGMAASQALPSLAHAQSPAPPTALFQAALAEVAAGRELNTGRIAIEIPRLAESGSSVECKVTVDNPLGAPSQVKTIHLLSEQNPIAVIARFHIAPETGPVEIETAVRLRTTQNVHAIAETTDGLLYADKAESVVLLAACLDAG